MGVSDAYGSYGSYRSSLGILNFFADVVSVLDSGLVSVLPSPSSTARLPPHSTTLPPLRSTSCPPPRSTTRLLPYRTTCLPLPGALPDPAIIFPHADKQGYWTQSLLHLSRVTWLSPHSLRGVSPTLFRLHSFASHFLFSEVRLLQPVPAVS